MNARKDYFLSGTMTAVSPLSYSLPPVKGKNKEDCSIQTINNKPFFTASGIRGKLRRLARDIVRQAVIDATGVERPWDLHTHYLNTSGGIGGKNVEKNDDADDAKLSKDSRSQMLIPYSSKIRAGNPLVSLFGVFQPIQITGRVAVGHAIAREAITPVLIRSTRSDDLRRDPGQFDFLDNSAEEIMLADGMLGKAVADLNKEINDLKNANRKASAEEKAVNKARQHEIEQQIKNLKTQKGQDGLSSESVLMPNIEYWAIPPDTQMSHTIRLSGVTEEEASIFFRALAAFADDPILGAHVSHGCGQVSASWTLKERVPGGHWTTVGEVVIPADLTGMKVPESIQALIDAPLDMSGKNFSADFFKEVESDLLNN